MGRVLVLLLAGCTATNFQMRDPADLGEAPDLTTADQSQERDLATVQDLAGADLAGVDLVQFDLASGAQDMARASADMVACGGQNQPCCQAAFPYCNDNTFTCYTTFCTNCGVRTQQCCGGDPVTHVDGSCYTGSCLDATHALMGHCN